MFERKDVKAVRIEMWRDEVWTLMGHCEWISQRYPHSQWLLSLLFQNTQTIQKNFASALWMERQSYLIELTPLLPVGDMLEQKKASGFSHPFQNTFLSQTTVLRYPFCQSSYEKYACNAPTA